MAGLCGVSPRTIERFFKLRMNATPRQWLGSMRKLEARKLANQMLPTKVMAMELGYTHASNFCRAFKREHGFATSVLRAAAGADQFGS
jgi:transcriptional regulator GlxA family with amidase domain